MICKKGFSSTSFDTGYTYDLNGNITSLTRYDKTGILIDSLTFHYSGNRVTRLSDGSGDVASVIDYPGFTSQKRFTYDDNGNVRIELHKLLNISYNILNLPEEIGCQGENRKINYYYTFKGEKLRKKVEDNGVVRKVDYCGPFVYETSSGVRTLKYLVTPEGRAVMNGSSWDYEYNLTDHLGNVRAVIRNNGGVAQLIQERHYYPFGMEMSSLSAGAGTNKYLYNGKEYQDEFGLSWYDYGARFYDPAIGRFHTQDRFAEKYLSLTPYQYAANNPIKFIDINGDSIVYKNESTAKYIASFTSKTITKKNGKVVENKNYHERFAEIIQKLDDSKTIYEFSDAFTPIQGAEQGQISTDREKVLVEFGTPDESYGSKSNLLFEETHHAYQVEKKSITINKEKKAFNMYLPEVEYEYEAKKFAVSAPGGSFSFTNPAGVTAKTQIGLIKYLNPSEGRRFLTEGYTERTFNGSTLFNIFHSAPYPPKK